MFYDDEQDEKEKMKELLKNPLFRAANADLVKKMEREIKKSEMERRVREFLRDNPGATFAQVVIETGVDMKILEDLIAEGRVDMVINSQDLSDLAEHNRQMIENLSRMGNFIHRTIDTQPKPVVEDDKKATGMYSKKENLKK